MTVKDRDAHPGGVGQRVDADWLHKIPAQHRHRPTDPRRMAVYGAQRPNGRPVDTLQQPVMQLPPQTFPQHRQRPRLIKQPCQPVSGIRHIGVHRFDTNAGRLIRP